MFLCVINILKKVMYFKKGRKLVLHGFFFSQNDQKMVVISI